jgi:hypothetical protein
MNYGCEHELSVTTVYVVITDENVLFRIFSTREKAEAWLKEREFRHYCVIRPITIDEEIVL